MDLRPYTRQKIAVDAKTRCWNWIGIIEKNGYGRVRHNGRSCWAHRVIYEMFRGPIPLGLELDHLCRNTRCVNPDHLEPVTRLINARRASNGRALKMHCKHGHPYNESNTEIVLDAGGKFRQRICKTCKRSWNRANKLRILEKAQR